MSDAKLRPVSAALTRLYSSGATLSPLGTGMEWVDRELRMAIEDDRRATVEACIKIVEQYADEWALPDTKRALPARLRALLEETE